MYLNEVGSVPLLSAEEEILLAKRVEAGVYAAELLRAADAGERRLSLARRRELDLVVRDGRAAKEKMIVANLRLVVTVVRRNYRRRMPLLDAIQEGNFGLIRAVEKFDYTKGYKFSTYAAWWIRQAMEIGVMEQSRTIRLPVHVMEALDRIGIADRALTVRLRHEPSVAELAAKTGIPAHRVADLRRAGRRAVSLDAPFRADEELRLGDVIEDADAESGPDAAEHLALVADVHAAVAALPPRQARVITERYGLTSGRPRTLVDVAGELGISRERVRQLENKAVKRLREDARDLLLLHWAG
ncbi:sigma-70 family RNA polymerase sigma factor [Actinophytocola sp.]|uniref:sigma-70 family RNA polymerase sigma factor n=1 Tax=Actinophytocola sp. TaxID=1872138 RepID=UPI0025C28BCD|nr:sigma-70 family RNA polymerase sigma factor [Actinophytocola sp.]